MVQHISCCVCVGVRVREESKVEGGGEGLSFVLMYHRHGEERMRRIGPKD